MGTEFKGHSKPLHQDHSSVQYVQNKNQRQKFHTEPSVKMLHEGGTTETLGQPPLLSPAMGLGTLLGPRDSQAHTGGFNDAPFLPPGPGKQSPWLSALHLHKAQSSVMWWGGAPLFQAAVSL